MIKQTLLLLPVLTIGTALAVTPTYVPLHRFQKTGGYDLSGGVVRDSKGNTPWSQRPNLAKLTEPFQSSSGCCLQAGCQAPLQGSLRIQRRCRRRRSDLWRDPR